MDGANLSVWVEPYYAKTPWYRELLAGLKSGLDAKRQKANISIIEEPDENVPSDTMLILAGETNQWFYRMLNFSYKRSIRVCVASSDPEFTANDVSSVSLDRQKDMSTMVQYLFDTKHCDIALFGINPSSPADQKRSLGYLQTVKLLGLPLSESDIYYTSGDVSICAKSLLENIGQYDAIISSNDLYAIYLLPYLCNKNISVPKEVYLASFGNTMLSRISKPSITSATLNHTELGRQAILLSLYMCSNPHISNMTVTIDGSFYSRQSTDEIPFSASSKPFHSALACNNITSYNDPHLSQIVKLEMFLAEGDKLNLSIMKWLISDRSLPELADHLFLSRSAIDYRLNKLYHHFSVSNRQELSSLMKSYMNFIDFSLIN